MHEGGNRVASNTPCHGSAGTGLRKRRPSTGGFANGTPLNTCTSRPSTIVERPRIGPLLVCTTSRSNMPYTGLITVMHSRREIMLHHKSIADILFYLRVDDTLSIFALCRMLLFSTMETFDFIFILVTNGIRYSWLHSSVGRTILIETTKLTSDFSK